ncbi:MAG: four helix bundle suffix domain-containing protein [Prevotella sp.]|nr:four helix bundle suffix domain-containing protein [Prevotella sp.]
MQENFQNNQNTQNTQSNQSQSLCFLPQHGHYRQLRVYKLAEIIYDITFYFTQHYLSKGDRTIDQMVQAARSGKQNIAEGNQAAATSSETEIKLTNVAKASLEELLTDYEDFLRVRHLEQWARSNPRLESMRVYLRSQAFMNEYVTLLPKLNPEEICNLCITLIHQAMYMLYRLIETMQRRFVTEGGIKEQMFRARVNYRNNRNNRSNQNFQSIQSTQNTQSTQNNQN